MKNLHRAKLFNFKNCNSSLFVAKFAGATLTAMTMSVSHSRLKPLLQHKTLLACCEEVDRENEKKTEAGPGLNRKIIINNNNKQTEVNAYV